MIQKEFFKIAQTDLLLKLRYSKSCNYPRIEGQEIDFDNDAGKMYLIDKTLLYEELRKRPHRIRAKHRRLTSLKEFKIVTLIGYSDKITKSDKYWIEHNFENVFKFPHVCKLYLRKNEVQINNCYFSILKFKKND